MGLNDDATAHRANKEIVIPTTIALDHPKTQPNSHLQNIKWEKATCHKTKGFFYGESHLNP